MMKKMVALLGAVLMTASAMAFAACDGDRGGKNPIWTSAVTEAAPTVGAMTALEGYTYNGTTGRGWYNFVRTDTETYETEYAVYNIVSDKMFTSKTSFSAVDDGLYVTMVTAEPEDPNGEAVTTYTFYDKDGVIVTANEDELVVSYSRFEGFRDGRYFAKLPDGSYEVMNAGIGKNYQGTGKVYAIGSYLLEINQSNEYGLLIDVYDSNRVYVRTVDVSRKMELPCAEELVSLQMWSVGGKLFMQGMELVPYDCDYDLVYSGMAVCLYTMVYEPAADKLEELKSFDFAVQEVLGLAPTTNAIILSGVEIVDKKPASEGIQMFGQDGKRYTDLQALLLNAEEIQYSGNYVMLSSDEEMQIYESGELKKTFDKNIYGNVAFCDGYLLGGGGVYTLDGQFKFEVGQSKYSHTADGVMWFYDTTDLYGYDIATGESIGQRIAENSFGKYYLVADEGAETYSMYRYGSSAVIFSGKTLATTSFSVNGYTDKQESKQYDLISIGTTYYRVETDTHVW